MFKLWQDKKIPIYKRDKRKEKGLIQLFNFIIMKKLVVVTISMLLLPVFMPYTMAGESNDSWVRIVQPQNGVYIYGKKIMNCRSYIFIGTDFVNVNVEASQNIFTVYMAIFDVMKKDTIDSTWDYDGSDGFSYNFSGLKSGIYGIAAVGAALDINEPIAFDWITPVVIIHA